MRMVFPGTRPPTDVDRYLLPHEQEVITIRRHPAVLLPWAAAAVGGLSATLAINGIAHEGRSVQFVAWLLTAFLFVELIVATLHWAVAYIVVTSHRMVIISGLSGRRVTEIPLVELRKIGLDRSLSGRLFGYGTFTLSGRNLVSYMPFPEQIYLEIAALLYPYQDYGD
jgi:hypothetical protein